MVIIRANVMIKVKVNLVLQILGSCHVNIFLIVYNIVI